MSDHSATGEVPAVTLPTGEPGGGGTWDVGASAQREFPDGSWLSYPLSLTLTPSGTMTCFGSQIIIKKKNLTLTVSH